MTDLVDTHAHLWQEDAYVRNDPDVLHDLFGHYANSDLRVADATRDDIDFLNNTANPDIEARFARSQHAWEQVQYTGYGIGPPHCKA